MEKLTTELNELRGKPMAFQVLTTSG